jgi:hypothetical protein
VSVPFRNFLPTCDEGGGGVGEEEGSVPFKEFLPTCDGGGEGIGRRKGVFPLRIFCPPVKEGEKGWGGGRECWQINRWFLCLLGGRAATVIDVWIYQLQNTHSHLYFYNTFVWDVTFLGFKLGKVQIIVLYMFVIAV